MNILYTTFTGADDKADPRLLELLSLEHRNIEWAILISDQRVGKPRYPTQQWREGFYAASPDSLKAAHLCGKETLIRFAELDAELVSELKHYQRVQLNFNAKNINSDLLDKLVEVVNSKLYLQLDGSPIAFIIQYNEANKDIISRFDTTHILFDASGGLGKTPEQWQAPLKGKLCGYAGGLGPDNIYQQLQIIRKVTSNSDIWIDMESNIRTDEVFDLDKVKKCLTSIAVFNVYDTFPINEHF